MINNKLPEVKEAQRDSCLEVLKNFNKILESARIKDREKAEYNENMHFFLQFVVLFTDSTVLNVESEKVYNWIKLAEGFSNYDKRYRVLKLLKLNFEVEWSLPEEPKNVLYYKVRDFIFWRRYENKKEQLMSPFFDSITQEDILDAEITLTPFYEALWMAAPDRDFTGVFVESDECIISSLKKYNLNVEKEFSVVDVGCGHGRLLARFREEFKNSKLIGTSVFEFSDEELQYLHEKNITPLYCTANKIDLPDNSQDVVMSSEVIEHLRYPQELVSEIYRILKPGGIFCITAPSKASYMYRSNPLSYLMVFLDALFPMLPIFLPKFHNLYGPLTQLPLVHYGFSISKIKSIFNKGFSQLYVETTRFTALRKFKIAKYAHQIPVIKKMGGLCLVHGQK